MPSYKMIPVVTYSQLLKALYTKNFQVYLLQFMCGYCKLFDRERIAMLWLSFRPIVFFYKPEKVEILLNNSNTIDKSNEYGFLHPWLGTGLLTSTGQRWKTHRKLLTPTFHFRILEDFVSVFNEQSAVLVNKMEGFVGKSWIDIVPHITACTLDVICETAMGVRLNAQSGGSEEYVNAIKEISEIFMYRVTKPWLWVDKIFFNCFPSGWRYRRDLNLVHGFTRKVIKEKKKSFLRKGSFSLSDEEKAKKNKKAFLERLLELHFVDDSFTEEDIRQEVDTFMFEGHDTTAMAISWALYNIGLHPEVQEKIFQELESIFGDDRDRPISADDLKEMKYLECVLKESLRLYPSVAFIAREIKENLPVGNYTIPTGSLCLILILALHQDSEQFPNPEKFDPDRFLPENAGGRHPYSYIPFSAGPRNCIGQKFALMEDKTILAHVLRKFKITSLDSTDKVHYQAGLTLKNDEPIRVSFQLRN
ncbi:cytochrome P450 4V2-like [Uloborus diversus]|uniref:cytochrome P450 4V2-like n=1 Tax=Uloborus diversus TaxID=327109 RepID=UPI0024091320|nr:cytochrome P450 4V2-like [Uloborus diversus]